jgi:hypothetical protein
MFANIFKIYLKIKINSLQIVSINKYVLICNAKITHFQNKTKDLKIFSKFYFENE